MKRFEDRVAIVTRGKSGIGGVTALAFAAEGARVVVAGRRETEGTAAVADLRRHGGQATFVATDVTRDADVRKLDHARCTANRGLTRLPARDGTRPAELGFRACEVGSGTRLPRCVGDRRTISFLVTRRGVLSGHATLSSVAPSLRVRYPLPEPVQSPAARLCRGVPLPTHVCSARTPEGELRHGHARRRRFVPFEDVEVTGSTTPTLAGSLSGLPPCEPGPR